MARKDHASETPATQLLKRKAVIYSEHLYDYVENGGTTESARQLDECVDAWGQTLSPELLEAIDTVRAAHRDPAQ